MEFQNMDINTIATGATADGVRYLQLFLSEYRSIFSEAVNPSCNKCLNNYLTKYKNYIMSKTNQNTSGYVLKAKYENMPLEFGSSILVNNTNITEEYALKLLEQDEGERFFASIPELSSDPEADRLRTAVKKAQLKVDNLKVDAKKQVVTLANNALEKAKAALQQYKDESTDVNQDVTNEIKVTLTEEDIFNAPELLEAGFKAGDEVFVDADDYENGGALTILGLADEPTQE